MAKPGRKPEPTKLKILKGNPGHRPLNTDEPEPEVFESHPEPPPYADLTPTGKRLWDDIAPILMKAGMFTKADQFLLLRYCDLWGAWLQARDMCRKFGDDNIYTEPDPAKPGQMRIKHTQPHSWTARYLQISKTMQTMEAELGLSPSSRTQVKAYAREVDDPIRAYLARRSGKTG